ncbi:MAG TPA: nitroreductase [Acidimicrobiales bacterium]|nr:nitroreductase [Acidimicrobiales bacterium]
MAGDAAGIRDLATFEGIHLLLHRRSISRLTEPAPTDEQLHTILLGAASAPDHGELRPWKFVVLRGEGKDAFGQVLADAYLRRCRDTATAPVPAKLEKERTKLGRAPLVVVVCAVRRDDPKIPWDDQLGSAYAAAENALLAATACGFGSMWRTGDPAFDPDVKHALGLRDTDAIAGFLYIGTPVDTSRKLPHQPDLTGLVEHWHAP